MAVLYMIPHVPSVSFYVLWPFVFIAPKHRIHRMQPCFQKKNATMTVKEGQAQGVMGCHDSKTLSECWSSKKLPHGELRSEYSLLFIYWAIYDSVHRLCDKSSLFNRTDVSLVLEKLTRKIFYRNIPSGHHKIQMNATHNKLTMHLGLV